jgi:biotin transport system substrate-specific component
MQNQISMARFYQGRATYFAWLSSATLIQKILLSFAMACLTGLAAQIAIPLPFTPVPITLQTFTVLLSGVVLGRKWGGVSQILYVGLGALGLPWFAEAHFGLAALLGPTGGYLLGFVLAAFFVGEMTTRYVTLRGFFGMAGILWFASFFLIQVPGLLGLAAWYVLVLQKTPDVITLLSLGCLPFVPGDVLKILLAASTAKLVTPKSN